MNINKKLLEYIEKKNITQRDFTRKIGLSDGALKKSKNIGSQYIKAIRDNFPDLNLSWLLFDEGDMFVNYNDSIDRIEETPTYYQQDGENKLVECQKRVIELQDEIRKLEKELFELKLEKNNIFTKLKNK